MSLNLTFISPVAFLTTNLLTHLPILWSLGFLIYTPSLPQHSSSPSLTPSIYFNPLFISLPPSVCFIFYFHFHLPSLPTVSAPLSHSPHHLPVYHSISPYIFFLFSTSFVTLPHFSSPSFPFTSLPPLFSPHPPFISHPHISPSPLPHHHLSLSPPSSTTPLHLPPARRNIRPCDHIQGCRILHRQSLTHSVSQAVSPQGTRFHFQIASSESVKSVR